MRAVLLLIALVLMAGHSPVNAQMLECEGFAFGYARFKCKPVGQPASKAASFCDVMNRQGGPFYWSRNDTEASKNRADLINAAGRRLCGWGR